MPEITGKVDQETYDKFQHLKALRYDKLNGPLLATLINEKYSRLEGNKKPASLKAQKEQSHE